MAIRTCGIACGRTGHGCRSNRAAGFTLVELLVVIGIISVLISLLLPSLNKARQAANTVKCASNIRQVGLALMNYAADNKGSLPYAYKSLPNDPPHSYNGWVLSWDDMLDRYLMQKKYSFSELGGVPSRDSEVLRCPDDASIQPVSFVGANKYRKTYSAVRTADFSTAPNIVARGMFYHTNQTTVAQGGKPTNTNFRHVKLTDAHPPSETLMVVELPHEQNVIGYGAFSAADSPSVQLLMIPKPYHNGFFNYLFVDGHVGLLSPFETYGTGTFADPRGMWTRAAND